MKASRFSRFAGAAGIGLAMFVGANAQAIETVPIDFDADGGADTYVEIGALDWAPGNALSIGAVNAIGAFIGGAPAGSAPTQFDSIFQSTLQGIGDANGDPLADPAGLNGTYELTIVGKAREFVSSVQGPIPTATFGLIPDNPADPNDNFIRIYFDDFSVGSKSNSLAGTGYDDGLLIFEGTIDALVSNFTRNPGGLVPLDGFGTNNYPGIESVFGTGATSLEARIDSADPDFFLIPAGPNGSIAITLFTTQQVLPFAQTNPSAQFFGGDLAAIFPNIGAQNGVDGPDFQFQADPNQSFGFRPAVPEPATAMLAMFGIAGMAMRRRRQA